MALSLTHPACMRRVRADMLVSLPIATRERGRAGVLTPPNAASRCFCSQAPAPGLAARRTAAAACITPSHHASCRSSNGAAAFGGGAGPSRYVARARWGTRRAAGAGDGGAPGTSDDDSDDDDTGEGPSDQDRGARHVSHGIWTPRHRIESVPRALPQGSERPFARSDHTRRTTTHS